MREGNGMTHKETLYEILSLCADNETSPELVGKIEKLAADALDESEPDPTPDKTMEDCVCQRCKKSFSLDVLVRDEIWEKISPKEINGWKSGGLLCPQCIVDSVSEWASIQTAELQKQLKEKEEALSFVRESYENVQKELNRKGEAIGELVEGLEEINHTCGTVNFSSHNQLKEAVEGAVEISDQLIQKHKQ